MARARAHQLRGPADQIGFDRRSLAQSCRTAAYAFAAPDGPVIRSRVGPCGQLLFEIEERAPDPFVWL
jgi:hypothetical protein